MLLGVVLGLIAVYWAAGRGRRRRTGRDHHQVVVLPGRAVEEEFVHVPGGVQVVHVLLAVVLRGVPVQPAARRRGRRDRAGVLDHAHHGVTGVNRELREPAVEVNPGRRLVHIPWRAAHRSGEPLEPCEAVGKADRIHALIDAGLEHVVGAVRAVQANPGRAVPAALAALRLRWLGHRGDHPGTHRGAPGSADYSPGPSAAAHRAVRTLPRAGADLRHSGPRLKPQLNPAASQPRRGQRSLPQLPDSRRIPWPGRPPGQAVAGQLRSAGGTRIEIVGRPRRQERAGHVGRDQPESHRAG